MPETGGLLAGLSNSDQPGRIAVRHTAPAPLRQDIEMRSAIEINIAIWGTMICAAMEAAQFFFEIF